MVALNVSRNALTSTIPSEFGNQLPRLQIIDLSSNQLNGTLPPSLGNASALVVLSVFNNSLSGPIPTEYVGRQLGKLKVLNTGSNQLYGTVPAIQGLSQLKQLSLGSNTLHGALPSMGTMQQLEVLDLHDNGFQGGIPQSLYNHSTLRYLLLHQNALSGSVALLPPGLIMVLLHDNRFSGQLPSFSSQHELAWLTVFNNQFGGALTLPTNARLHLLFAQSNRLSCNIVAPNTSGTNPIALPGNAFNGPPPVSLQLSTRSLLPDL